MLIPTIVPVSFTSPDGNDTNENGECLYCRSAMTWSTLTDQWVCASDCLWMAGYTYMYPNGVTALPFFLYENENGVVKVFQFEHEAIEFHRDNGDVPGHIQYPNYPTD